MWCPYHSQELKNSSHGVNTNTTASVICPCEAQNIIVRLTWSYYRVEHQEPPNHVSRPRSPVIIFCPTRVSHVLWYEA